MAAVKKGSFNTNAYTTGGKTRYITFNWEQESQSITDNETIINYEFIGAGTYDGYIKSGNFNFEINGITVYQSATRINLFNGTVIAKGQVKIPHNSNGSKKFTASAEAGIWYTAVNCEGSGEWELTDIPRKATTTKATNFTDESNPQITFSNPGGFQLAPYFNIYDEGGTKVYGIVRSKGTYSSPYTFSLSDSEREALRNATNLQKQYTVYEGITTYDGSTSLGYSSVKAILSIINANPIFTVDDVTYADTDESVVAITEDDQQIVQNKSNLVVTFASAEGLKGATIEQYELNLNLMTKTSTVAGAIDFGKVNSAQDLELYVTVTDSRGFTTQITKTISMVAYSLPSAVVTLERLNSYEDETYLTVDGSVASVNGKNTMSISYQYKQLLAENFNEPISINDNEKYTLSCDKKSVYLFNIIVEDAFGNVFTKEVPLQEGIFVFFIETLKRAVGINAFPEDGEALRVEDGIAYFADGIKYPAKVLWSGALQMTDIDDITLSEKISEQATGIELIFSEYSDETIRNYSFQHERISKYMVSAHNGVGHVIKLCNNTLNVFANKYLYIYDDHIKGHQNNDTTGTGASGITFTNNRFILRYVIGI